MAGELHDDIREGRVDSVFILRIWADSSDNRGSIGRVYSQIADEIERLREMIQHLSAALSLRDPAAAERILIGPEAGRPK